MSQAPSQLSIVAVASEASRFDDVVAANSLLVVSYPDEDARIYWRGERLSGTIDTTKPMARSVTDPQFWMTIDGESVKFAPASRRNKFVFRGETLTIHGGGGRVDYDAEADRPVF